MWDWDRFLALLSGGNPATSVLDQIVAGAERHGVPPLALVALAYAESRLIPDARRDGVWPDVSTGLFQQTARFAPEYLAGGYGPEYPGAAVVEPILSKYLDIDHAIDVAAPNLRAKLEQSGGDLLKRLALYNFPAGGGLFKSEAHRLNYTSAIVESRRLLGE
jgi:hypothetical protein